MLNTDFLHADPTFIAFGLVGRLIFRNSGLRFAFGASSNILFRLHFLSLEELLNYITRNERGILLRVENTLHTGIGIIPEDCIELRALLAADVAFDILREDD